MKVAYLVAFLLGVILALIFEAVTLPSLIQSSFDAVYDCSESSEALLICRVRR